MKKPVFNIIVAALIVLLMFVISIFAISSGYTPESIATNSVADTTN